VNINVGDSPTLALIVPCYNEEDIIVQTLDKLSNQVAVLIEQGTVSGSSFVCFVDDGSTDKTWEAIKRQIDQNNYVKGIKLSRNFGHQNALLAGILTVKDRCDCSVSIDADLQQDEKAIEKFVTQFRNGSDVVFGVRNDRDSDGIFKKMSAGFFYNLMQKMGVSVHKNHADYRLLSRRAMDNLGEFSEGNLFLRGIVPKLGFKQTIVNFDVKEREAGESKYNLRRMLAFALNGITSFSITPLRIVTYLGFTFTFFSACMSVYILAMKLLYQTAMPGWASIILPVYLLGGIQLLSIGVIGEYVGRVYMESKARPRFIVEESSFD